MERAVLRVVEAIFGGLILVLDAPYRTRHPGFFRTYWLPRWLTRWRDRVAQR